MKMHYKFKTIIYILMILNSLLSFSQFKTGQIVKIKDGNTVVVSDENNNRITIRLEDVDCPEKNQAFGTKAKQFTSEQVYFKYIMYVITDKDRSGRNIGKIYYDNGKYLSEEIIKAGYGRYDSKYSKSTTLSTFESIARANKKGLWIDENPIAPRDFRKINFLDDFLSIFLNYFSGIF